MGLKSKVEGTQVVQPSTPMKVYKLSLSRITTTGAVLTEKYLIFDQTETERKQRILIPTEPGRVPGVKDNKKTNILPNMLRSEVLLIVNCK